jgi:hypothetical protein
MSSVVTELCSRCSSKSCIHKDDGSISVRSIEIFKEYLAFYRGKLPEDRNVISIVEDCTSIAVNASRNKYGVNPTKDSLKNCRGRWFELVFCSVIAELRDDLIKTRRVLVPLPVARLETMEWWHLLNVEERKRVSGLKTFSSNPDMVCVEVHENLLGQVVETIDPIQLWSGKTWNRLEGKLSLANVKAFASLKTSMRPDRRYLSLFEAVTVKAVASYFGVKIKYYVVCPKFTPADLKVFRAKTLHDQFSSEAVDRLFTFNKVGDLYSIVREIAA